jgi:AcrR family transcriptional regulator
MSASSAQERRERQRGEARRTILDAAGEILMEEGTEAFSMRRLAARCGYTLPTIYHHFGDKPGLLEALLDERFREMADAIRSAASPVDDTVENLRRMLRAFVDFGLSHPRHYQLMISMIQEGSEPPAAEEARELLESPVRTLLERGRLRAGEVKVCTQVIWAFAHGLISLLTSRADLEWAPDLLDVALDGMLHGVVIPDSARPAEDAA